MSGRQPGDTMSLARYRAAVIGLGRMGSTFDEEKERFSRWGPPHAHAACYRAVPGVELVAGADPYESQRGAFAHKWGVDEAHLYADFRAMLERERPEIVSVCTSARPRAGIVGEVLRVGRGFVKAIWAEKPMAISLAEADAMVEGCQEAGVKLAVGASRSWDATYNRMRELIELGEVGEVLQVSGLGRCTLSSNGSHLLTLVAYLAGGLRARCEWVFGQMESDAQAAGDDDLAGYGCLQFANGVQAFVRSTDCGAADWEFEVLGTKGRLRGINDAEEVEFWKLAPPMLPGRRREPARHVFPHPVGESRANVRTVHNLLAAMELGEQLHCDGEAGRQALEIAIAMRELHRRGGVKVTLPLEDRSLRMVSSETLRGDAPVAVRRAQETAARARDAAP